MMLEALEETASLETLDGRIWLEVLEDWRAEDVLMLLEILGTSVSLDALDTVGASEDLVILKEDATKEEAARLEAPAALDDVSVSGFVGDLSSPQPTNNSTSSAGDKPFINIEWLFKLSRQIFSISNAILTNYRC